MDDVAVDAKRILLRYGAPIDVLDDVSEVERIELARLIAKTSLRERQKNLRQVLADRGYMEPPPPKTRRGRAKTATPKAGMAAASPAAKPGADGKGAAHNQKPTARQRATGHDAVSQRSSPKSRSRKAASAKPKSRAKRTSKKSGKPAGARSKAETRKSGAAPRKSRAKSSSRSKAAAKRTARPKRAGKKSARASAPAQSKSRSKGSSRAKQGRRHR